MHSDNYLYFQDKPGVLGEVIISLNTLESQRQVCEFCPQVGWAVLP